MDYCVIRSVIIAIITVMLTAGRTDAAIGARTNRGHLARRTGKNQAFLTDPEFAFSDEERLYNHLFSRYNPSIRPVVRPTDTVNVSLTFSLMQIHRLDEKTQVFRTYGWLIVEWSDPRLQWTQEFFGNMSEFVTDSNLLWTPELALINAVEWQFPDFTQYHAIITHNGSVRWEPAGVFETSCKIDITFYPYDTQECFLVFGTWAFTSLQVNLTNSTADVILDDYNTSGEWRIKGHVVERKEFVYECCDHMRFSKIQFTIYLDRRHLFYTMNMVLPCAMLSSLTLVTFLSPPDQGEKISLGISILLSFSVFMLALSENMPKTSESLPLFGVYTTFVMLMNTWSVMLTVLVLNLHHRNRSKPVPKWVRTFVFEGLARILCMYSKDDSRNRDYDVHPYSKYKYDDYKRDKNIRERSKSRDGYSLAMAAAQFKGNIRPSGLLMPGVVGTHSRNNAKPTDSQPNQGTNKYSNLGTGNKNPPPNLLSALDEGNKDYESLLKAEHFLNYELQEWKRLARIVDRLFFWMTLVALISVSAGMIGMLMTND